MSDRRREILTAIAEGRLSPEEGMALLDATEPEQPAGALPDIRVRVSTGFARLTVTGDPTVREAVAEGAHRVRREGDLLVIEGDDEPFAGGAPWFRFGPRGGAPWQAFGERRLTVRVNPDLPLELTSTAGSLSVRGTRGPLRVELSAGSARLEDIAAPFDISASAGSIALRARIDRGESRIRCEAGSASVVLLPGSNVRVRARSVLGRLLLPQPAGTGGFGMGDERETVVGDGLATLDLEANMGSASVSVES